MMLLMAAVLVLMPALLAQVRRNTRLLLTPEWIILALYQPGHGGKLAVPSHIACGEKR